MRDGLLAMVGARRGHFRLESGHHGQLWLDLDSLFRRPRELRPAVLALARQVADHDVQLVCGPLSGGAFVAQLVASELDLEFCYTERAAAPHGADLAEAHPELYATRYRLPATVSLQGLRVAVLDDVVNAGSAVRSTLAAVRAGGGTPVMIGALLVLGGAAAALASDQGLALATIGEVDNTLWRPDDCPLCATDVPLQDLTT